MTPREVSRRTFRAALFQRRGLSATDAQRWAERLTERDADRDDRRICLECAGLQQSGHCRPASMGRIQGASSRYQPVTTLLQRCEGFAFVTP